MDSYKYDLRGVSASKSEVHAAIQNLDKGLYPNAFCKILPDITGNDPSFCNIMHADTAGTKTSLAYLYWKETGEEEVWKGIAQDAIVMNLDDMACAGCVDNIVLSSTIGRNKHLISGTVIKTIIDATVEFIEQMRAFGVNIVLAGGETADVGDIVRTIDVGYTAFARMPRSAVIENQIVPGDVIVGFSSYGQTVYESTYNGGMGSNGLTAARHDVLANTYTENYPESFDPNTPRSVVYTGASKLTDKIMVNGEAMTVGKLLLSPTRTYLPLIKPLLATFRQHIHGLIHCTGGGQTKVIKFLNGCKVIKDNLFPLPPLFQLIHEQSGTDWKEMYQVFNMGHRLEAYLPENAAPMVMELASGLGLESRIVGRVEEASFPSVELQTEYGIFQYSDH